MVRELMTFPPAPLALAPGPLEAVPLAPTEMETLPAPDVDGADESLTKPEAISSAFWASSAEATDPVRMILSATVRTWISLPGIAALSNADNSPTSRPTETSMVAIFRPSRARAKMVVWPLATPDM